MTTSSTTTAIGSGLCRACQSDFVHKYVIMGIQGSGKGTQAKLLCAEFDLVHISVGDIFRWNVQYHTKVGAQVRRTMAAGALVDDELVESIVRDRLTLHDWNYGFILDGFPRNARQAEFFLESYDINGVIVLDLPDDEVMRRVLARRLCGQCGLDYNLIAHRPSTVDTCDVCGGALVVREDDNSRGAHGASCRLSRQDEADPGPLRAQGVRGDRGRQSARRRSPG